MPLLRTLKQKFGIAAPRVAVRTHIAWYWRWLALVAIGAALLGAGWVLYNFGMTFGGYRQSESEHALAGLNETVGRQQQEITELRARMAHAESQLQIERAAYVDLVQQMKALTEENATLKEDLVFFQTLMPSGGKPGTITINRFTLEPDALPGEYRYRLLLVQTGRRATEFEGRLQFVLNLTHDEKALVLMLPPESERNAKEYQLKFRFFQRIEGTFRVAPDAAVKSFQVRVFEKGANTPKLTQTATAS
jgi:hypothetical protein